MSDNATFYTQLAYAGDAHSYKLGSDESLYPGDLNDKFKSLRVGKLVKVLAWQHNESGQYREWDTDQENITDIGGLSRFKVAASTTLPIAVRLQDLTGAPEGSYSLKVSSYEVGEATISSGDPEFRLVGIMPESGPPVTTAIYVRNGDGHYVATGAVHFTWNSNTKSVDIADATNFPENMENERTGRNEFTFRLVSV
ncbi:beta/gamma crystallin domain-containing protein [Streptomyces sp. NPDC058409]|uniref:beta/gamma crystallin domain-containing protein n=1 Tax=Streptomyces sp. NPDC058409 TaxID=3346484 RepID=UPI00364E2137